MGYYGGFLGWGIAWQHAPCLPLLPCGARGQAVSKVVRAYLYVVVRPWAWRSMWVSIASDAACAAALQQAVVDFGLFDTDALQAVLQIPESAAGLARALCTALRAAPLAAEIGTMTDVALTGNVVDTSTAEAMIDEALCMVAERLRLVSVQPRSVLMSGSRTQSSLLCHSGRQRTARIVRRQEGRRPRRWPQLSGLRGRRWSRC